MKLSSRKLDRQAPRLSMTSMIDVVFLLLIFFITTSHFVPTERHLDPAIQVNKTASGTPSELEPVIVEVIERDGTFLYRLGSRELATVEELTEVLKAVPPSPDGAFVRVGDSVPFGMAAGAIQACKAAQFIQVTYVPLAAQP